MHEKITCQFGNKGSGATTEVHTIPAQTARIYFLAVSGSSRCSCSLGECHHRNSSPVQHSRSPYRNKPITVQKQTFCPWCPDYTVLCLHAILIDSCWPDASLSHASLVPFYIYSTHVTNLVSLLHGDSVRKSWR